MLSWQVWRHAILRVAAATEESLEAQIIKLFFTQVGMVFDESLNKVRFVCPSEYVYKSFYPYSMRFYYELKDLLSINDLGFSLELVSSREFLLLQENGIIPSQDALSSISLQLEPDEVIGDSIFPTSSCIALENSSNESSNMGTAAAAVAQNITRPKNSTKSRKTTNKTHRSKSKQKSLDSSCNKTNELTKNFNVETNYNRVSSSDFTNFVSHQENVGEAILSTPNGSVVLNESIRDNSYLQNKVKHLIDKSDQKQRQIIKASHNEALGICADMSDQSSCQGFAQGSSYFSAFASNGTFKGDLVDKHVSDSAKDEQATSTSVISTCQSSKPNRVYKKKGKAKNTDLGYFDFYFNASKDQNNQNKLSGFAMDDLQLVDMPACVEEARESEGNRKYGEYLHKKGLPCDPYGRTLSIYELAARNIGIADRINSEGRYNSISELPITNFTDGNHKVLTDHMSLHQLFALATDLSYLSGRPLSRMFIRGTADEVLRIINQFCFTDKLYPYVADEKYSHGYSYGISNLVADRCEKDPSMKAYYADKMDTSKVNKLLDNLKKQAYNQPYEIPTDNDSCQEEGEKKLIKGDFFMERTTEYSDYEVISVSDAELGQLATDNTALAHDNYIKALMEAKNKKRTKSKLYHHPFFGSCMPLEVLENFDIVPAIDSKYMVVLTKEVKVPRAKSQRNIVTLERSQKYVKFVPQDNEIVDSDSVLLDAISFIQANSSQEEFEEFKHQLDCHKAKVAVKKTRSKTKARSVAKKDDLGKLSQDNHKTDHVLKSSQITNEIVATKPKEAVNTHYIERSKSKALDDHINMPDFACAVNGVVNDPWLEDKQTPMANPWDVVSAQANAFVQSFIERKKLLKSQINNATCDNKKAGFNSSCEYRTFQPPRSLFEVNNRHHLEIPVEQGSARAQAQIYAQKAKAAAANGDKNCYPYNYGKNLPKATELVIHNPPKFNAVEFMDFIPNNSSKLKDNKATEQEDSNVVAKPTVTPRLPHHELMPIVVDGMVLDINDKAIFEGHLDDNYAQQTIAVRSHVKDPWKAKIPLTNADGSEVPLPHENNQLDEINARRKAYENKPEGLIHILNNGEQVRSNVSNEVVVNENYYGDYEQELAYAAKIYTSPAISVGSNQDGVITLFGQDNSNYFEPKVPCTVEKQTIINDGFVVNNAPYKLFDSKPNLSHNDDQSNGTLKVNYEVLKAQELKVSVMSFHDGLGDNDELNPLWDDTPHMPEFSNSLSKNVYLQDIGHIDTRSLDERLDDELFSDWSTNNRAHKTCPDLYSKQNTHVLTEQERQEFSKKAEVNSHWFDIVQSELASLDQEITEVFGADFGFTHVKADDASLINNDPEKQELHLTDESYECAHEQDLVIEDNQATDNEDKLDLSLADNHMNIALDDQSLSNEAMLGDQEELELFDLSSIVDDVQIPHPTHNYSDKEAILLEDEVFDDLLEYPLAICSDGWEYIEVESRIINVYTQEYYIDACNDAYSGIEGGKPWLAYFESISLRYEMCLAYGWNMHDLKNYVFEIEPEVNNEESVDNYSSNEAEAYEHNVHAEANSVDYVEPAYPIDNVDTLEPVAPPVEPVDPRIEEYEQLAYADDFDYGFYDTSEDQEFIDDYALTRQELLEQNTLASLPDEELMNPAPLSSSLNYEEPYQHMEQNDFVFEPFNSSNVSNVNITNIDEPNVAPLCSNNINKSGFNVDPNMMPSSVGASGYIDPNNVLREPPSLPSNSRGMDEYRAAQAIDALAQERLAQIHMVDWANSKDIKQHNALAVQNVIGQTYDNQNIKSGLSSLPLPSAFLNKVSNTCNLGEHDQVVGLNNSNQVFGSNNQFAQGPSVLMQLAQGKPLAQCAPNNMVAINSPMSSNAFGINSFANTNNYMPNNGNYDPTPVLEEVPLPPEMIANMSHSQRRAYEGYSSLCPSKEVNPSKTFASYVIEPTCSKLVHAVYDICNTICTPGYKYPLFIHGPSGVGKTHLLSAMINKVKAEHPHLKVAYVRSEDFIKQYVASIADMQKTRFSDRQVYFQKAFTDHDLLIFDDIQSLVKGEKSRKVFFDIVDDFLTKPSAQLVLSADVPASALTALGFSDDLTSRINSGISIELKTPGHKARREIIKAKCEELGMNMCAEILEYMALNVSANVRDIEGALRTIHAMMKDQNSTLTFEEVARNINNFIVNRTNVLPLDSLLALVSAEFKVSNEEMFSPSKKKIISQARSVACCLARDFLPELSLNDLAKVFKKDHSSIHEAILRTRERLVSDYELKSRVQRIVTSVNKLIESSN